MVVALTIGEALPRRWFRRQRAVVESQKIRVGEGSYTLLTARPDRHGRLDWQTIRQLAGRAAGRMLLPVGLQVPPGYGIGAFDGQLLGQEMMAITAVYLLRVIPSGRRTPVAIYDPEATMPQLACALLPYTSEVQVVSARPAQYAGQEEQAMREYGATFLITGATAPLHRATLVLAPDGMGGLQANTRGFVLSGVQETGRHVVGGYLPTIPAEWFAARPDGCDPWRFLCAMYEWGGLRGILARPPAALWSNGRWLRTRDAVCKLAGLDIGISV